MTARYPAATGTGGTPCIMASLRPTMRGATFTFWDVPAEQLPLTWDTARQRLAEQARTDGASAGPSSRER
jgi:hypothetical protein